MSHRGTVDLNSAIIVFISILDALRLLSVRKMTLLVTLLYNEIHRAGKWITEILQEMELPYYGLVFELCKYVNPVSKGLLIKMV